jgi:hypothetical protein
VLARRKHPCPSARPGGSKGREKSRKVRGEKTEGSALTPSGLKAVSFDVKAVIFLARARGLAPFHVLFQGLFAGVLICRVVTWHGRIAARRKNCRVGGRTAMATVDQTSIRGLVTA